MIFHYLKYDGKLVPDGKEKLEREKFFNQFSDGQILEADWQTPNEIRTSQANNYLWGAVYNQFVINGNFDSVEETHSYFTKQFLSRHDVIDLDEESLSNFSSKLMKYCSQHHKPIYRIIGNTVDIDWVYSTSKLSKKAFIDYIESVKNEGANLGIIFQDLESFKGEMK